MTTIHESFQTLTTMAAAAAAAAALLACGGGGADGQVDDLNDQPAASIRAEAQALLSSVNQMVDAARPSATGASWDMTTDGSPNAPTAFSGLPGIEQTNLVANKPGCGASKVEPALKNAWGIAILPAGQGGHFRIGAAGAGRSIQYVGDVGDQPLFQDDLAVVDTAGPDSGVAFNGGAQFVVSVPDDEGSTITAPAKFLFANLSGTLGAWTERARPDGGFDRDGATCRAAADRRVQHHQLALGLVHRSVSSDRAGTRSG